MKHLIILGDGMADHPVPRLGEKHCCSMQISRTWTISPVKAAQGVS